MGEAKRRKAAAQDGRGRQYELQALFDRLRIDPSQPGFYDSPEFMAAEERNSRFLEHYAEWVIHRDRTPEYDARVREILPKLAGIIADRIERHAWYGACFPVSWTVSRILDRLGIWNTTPKGSTSIYLPGDSRHFAIIDKNDGPRTDRGHMWLIVPPFDIVDFTLHFQRWMSEDAAFRSAVPRSILVEDSTVVASRPSDVIAPAARALLPALPDIHYRRLPQQRRIETLFAPRRVNIGNADVRYVVSLITATKEPLEEINTDGYAGAPAIQIWREDVAPAFGLSPD